MNFGPTGLEMLHTKVGGVAFAQTPALTLNSLHFNFFIIIFLFGNIYIRTRKPHFKKHWMSLVCISLVYYKREAWKLIA